MRTAQVSVIAAGVIAFLLLMTNVVLVAVVTHDYWGIACLPAGALIGWVVGWHVNRRTRKVN